MINTDFHPRYNSVGRKLWPRPRDLGPGHVHLLKQLGGGAGLPRVGGAGALRLLAGRGRGAPHPPAQPHGGAPQWLPPLQDVLTGAVEERCPRQPCEVPGQQRVRDCGLHSRPCQRR